MRASELIGKRAIRTAPTSRIGDHSYMGDPITILYADDTHIVYRHKLIGEERRDVLRADFADDNWRDYDELMRLADEVDSKLGYVADGCGRPTNES